MGYPHQHHLLTTTFGGITSLNLANEHARKRKLKFCLKNIKVHNIIRLRHHDAFPPTEAWLWRVQQTLGVYRKYETLASPRRLVSRAALPLPCPAPPCPAMPCLAQGRGHSYMHKTKNRDGKYINIRSVGHQQHHMTAEWEGVRGIQLFMFW